MIECPECENSYSPQGLFGHLDKGHGLSGEELEEAYQQALSSREEGGDTNPEAAEQPLSASGQPAEEPEEESRKRWPVPQAGAGQAAKRDERAAETSGEDEPRVRAPLRSAVERLRRARARKAAVEEEMETESEGGFLRSSREEIPANETWKKLREEYEKEVEEARAELQRQVERREADRAM